MDFNTDTASAFSLQNAADSSKFKSDGFAFSKQPNNNNNNRALNEEVEEEDDLRDFKMAKTSSCGEGLLPKYPWQRSNGSTAEAHHHQMLSFSSPSSQHHLTFPYYHYASNAFGRSSVINGGSMQGVRGPFTPSQWMELEHQALIYKYITANVPIPSYLLNPIRKAFDSAGFSVLRSNALGWGGFQLGFSNTDPEPGRCRRTDGKKWRCSRDAVVDQKYCERHMNRGRHRSRKPVEGQQPAHSNPNPKPSSINLQLTNNNHNHLSGTGIPTHSRDKPNADGEYQLTAVPRATAKDNQYSPQKHRTTFQEFGLVCSDSLLNPLNRSSSLVTSKNDDYNTKSHQHALRQFMDEWPKSQDDPSPIPWPHVYPQPDRTQLSISIPVVTSDYMSSTSSPTNEKLTSSPPRLSQELEMGLRVGSVDRNQRQTNWVPISWEPTAIGGPLGEALHNTSNSIAECGNAKQFNLIDSWDNSPRLALSPTGVLQRGPFASLSNSSAASSPRSSHCNGIINPGLMNPSLPAL